jgi:hypothetical protein
VCHAEAAFAPYGSSADSMPLPHFSLLHGWVKDSLQRIQQAAPGSAYLTDVEPLLPTTADSVFSFYSTAPPFTTAKLQSELSAKANKHIVKAAAEHMLRKSKQGDKWEWAHNKAITANGAWGWKLVQPETPQLRLSDVEYTIAARLNLGLKPFTSQTMAVLPEHCPLCPKAKEHVKSLHADPWHWLACKTICAPAGELTRRHDAVVDAVYRVAWQVGAQVQKEVKGLDVISSQRPDLQIVFPGRMILADVAVGHSLTVSQIAKSQLSLTTKQSQKDAKYRDVAARLGAELLNLCADSCGGLATGASQLVSAIGEEGERWSLGTWKSADIERQLLGAIAIAVQRGNALAMLSGNTRTACARVQEVEREVKGEAGEGMRRKDDGCQQTGLGCWGRE